MRPTGVSYLDGRYGRTTWNHLCCCAVDAKQEEYGPKMAQNGPKTAPKMAQDGPKKAPWGPVESATNRGEETL